MNKKPDPQPPAPQHPGPPPIVQPMIDELVGMQKPKADDIQTPKAPPEGPVHPSHPAEPPAELDQDAGGGYNPDHTYPQT